VRPTTARPWTEAQIPPQAGRLAVVTGATGGIGWQVASELARAGASVLLASRNAAKGEAALARIRKALPGADIRFELLDLASLDSVAAFAGRMLAAGRPVDILVNNAAVMALPRRGTTQDGHEAQIGINFLGHFALTARLLPLLRQAAAPRVVSLSSIAAWRAAIDLADLQSRRRYSPMGAYRASKLAMLIFALELQRRAEARGWGLASIAAHPGVARTDLFDNGPGSAGAGRITWALLRPLMPLFSQSARDGARPVLFAATAPEAKAGGYYGATGPREMFGPVGPAWVPPRARDAALAAALWTEAERLAGVAFD
jgi:NAD(P)-dependent dehydrogenase (short-subunit alcohol dehydrogenase family)